MNKRSNIKKCSRFIPVWNKKAQVTLFVIIGLVLLIGAGLIYFLTSSQQTTPETDIKNDLVDVGEEYRPVDLYVKTCLSSIGVSVLEQIGQHGGYLNPLETLEYDPLKPYDGDGLLLTNSEQSFIPYWVYIESPTEQDTTIYSTIKMPTLEDIERSHASEIDADLLKCINNFQSLEFSGAEIVINENPKTEVTYTEDSVIIQTKLPLTVTTADGVTKDIESFYTILDIPFKKYYDLSRYVVSQEYENQYLENLIVTLIGYYGRVDSSAIPPFYGITQGYAYNVWVQTDINQKLKTLLLDTVPLIQVQGTNNTYDVTALGLDEKDTAFLNSLNLPLFLMDYPELEISHLYLDWPIYSKVWPSEGELIRSTPNNYNIPGWYTAQDQTYNFFYDVAYPVVVELREPNAYLGKDFVFMFAMESNIRKNLDWRAYAADAGPILWDPETDITTELNQEEEQFDAVANKSYNIPSTAKKLFNKQSQFISQPIMVKTRDYLTGLPLDEVNVQIGIGTYARAVIGSTEIKNGEAIFEGFGPIVKSGYVSLNKNGYLSESEFITLDNSTTLKDLGTVTLLPLQKKTAFVKVLEMLTIVIPNNNESLMMVNSINDLDTMKNYLDSVVIEPGEDILVMQRIFERNMTDSETVTLNIDYLALDGLTSKQSSFAQFTGNVTSEATIELVPGRYTLTAMLFDNDGVVIPAKSKKICNGDDCDEIPEDSQYIPSEPIEMKPAIWGGLDFNESVPWFISSDDTYTENNVTFYVLKFSQPKTIDDLSQIGNLAQLSSSYRSRLLPKLTYPTQ